MSSTARLSFAHAQMLVGSVGGEDAFSAVDADEPGEQLPHAGREGLVGEFQAGKAGVAAHRRDHLAIEHGEARRPLHPGEVHVPLLADHAARVLGLADEADDVVEALERHVHGVAAERAEAASHPVQALGVQLLIAHREHVEEVEGAAKVLEGRLVGLGGKVDAADLGPEGAGQRQHVEPFETRIPVHGSLDPAGWS